MAFLKQISGEEIIFHEKCGGGSYGSVYRATWKMYNRQVAVKKLLTLEKEVPVASSTFQLHWRSSFHNHLSRHEMFYI